jgi:hypothetical protein
LFLLLLAGDRRWRDCALVVVFTAALNLGALFFFRGHVVTNTFLFLQNVFVFSKGFGKSVMTDASWNISFSNLARVPYAVFLHRAPSHLSRYHSLFSLATVALVFWAVRREQPFWKKVLLVTIAQVGIPWISCDYNLVYLVIPLLLYFQEGSAQRQVQAQERRQDRAYLICFGLLFAPKNYGVLGLEYQYVLTPQAFINPLLLLGLLLGLALSGGGRAAASARRSPEPVAALPEGTGQGLLRSA